MAIADILAEKEELEQKHLEKIVKLSHADQVLGAAYPRDRELYKKCKCGECGTSFPALHSVYYQSDSELLLDILYAITRVEEKIDGLYER